MLHMLFVFRLIVCFTDFCPFVVFCYEAMKKRNNVKKEEQFPYSVLFLFFSFSTHKHTHTALLETGKHKLWIGLMLDPEHGWQWSDAKPFRYLRWTSGKFISFLRNVAV